MKLILELILIVILLLLAALTAASETSIIAVSRLKLRRLASAGSKTAKLILKILETPERFFGTILVANNTVDTLLASLLTAIMISAIGEGKGIFFATFIATFFIIVFEVAAKTLAARNSEKMSLALAGPFRVLIAIFSPVVRILEVITNGIIRLIGGGDGVRPSLVTEEEIRALIKIGEEEGVLHKEKSKMLAKVFDFSDAVVKTVMRPKEEIVSIDIASSLDGILAKVLESGYSRIPVFKDAPDNIVGIINMKDLLLLSANKDLVVLQDIVYPATFVQESKKVSDLLKEFQKGHTHIAVVTDDKKSVKGIITLEDLLEEIVGEIEDEYDVRPARFKNK